MSTVAKSHSPVTRITNKSLKDFMAANKAPTKVVGPVERYLMTRDLDMSRSQTVLHPSEIIKSDWCIRESYYKILNARQGNLTAPDRPGLRLESIFDMGHAIHHKWQRWLGAAGVLLGDWKCLECNEVHRFDLKPESCRKCGETSSFAYGELGLTSGLISGHTDGWIVNDGDNLLEIKSVGTGTIRVFDKLLLDTHDGNLEKAFEGIRQPFVDHRRQGQTYLRLAHDMYDKGLNPLAPEGIVFLYENKANQAFKEFHVGYAPSQVDDVWGLALDVEWAFRRKKAPACNQSLKGCKKCKPFTDED